MEKNQVVATVGNKQITQDYIQKVLSTLDPQRAMQFYSEEGKKKLVEELVNQELFYLDALTKELDQSPSFLSEIEAMKENLLKQYAINQLLKDITVSEDEVQAYYSEHKEKFVAPESVRASHILVDEEAQANEIISDINNGLSFEEAAQKHSKCPSNAKGGDLGSFTRGKMVPEFEEAAFALAVDEVSQPVKTQFGYHIIKVSEKNPSEITPFEGVKDQLTQQLVSMKQQEVYYSKVEELKTQYPVEVNI
ncbi:peptidylprolyl isomerase [Alkaliphilus transvaalensis]|uniref:peptidylprolyl isomerase n=1 Tax=Alkaliphilus transvaalensis TaxID=114628 RepID=UPI00047B771F|nr:peptidylprolyl isomerase [Alkaliphilus transvaalensis]